TILPASRAGASDALGIENLFQTAIRVECLGEISLLLEIGRNARRDSKRRIVALPLIIEEKEGLVFLDGSAARSAVLIVSIRAVWAVRRRWKRNHCHPAMAAGRTTSRCHETGWSRIWSRC